MLEYCPDHSWTMILLLIVNAVFSRFFLALGIFIADWNHVDDDETEATLEKCMQKALEDAAALV